MFTTPDDDLQSRAVTASTDAIFCQDLDGAVLTWNPAAERLYGFRADEMIGEPSVVLAVDEARGELLSAFARAACGESVEHFDSRHRHQDGTTLVVSVSVVPLPNEYGQVSALATTVTDIGVRSRLAQELAALRNELERNNAVLRRSNRDLEQFAYVASHDLSEPLRVITGYITQLERQYEPVFDERAKRYMHHIVDASSRMRTLIEDLLDYSRFLRETPEPTPVDLTSVVEKARAATGQSAGAGGERVEVRPLPTVLVDPTQLQSLLQNLLSNALKFARADRPAHVVVWAAEDDGWVTLHVDDNGIGIEPEYRERVFRMFQRLHVREAYAGNGIGLAISQQVVERTGGRIWVEDSPLGGTRVSCTLPSANFGAA